MVAVARPVAERWPVGTLRHVDLAEATIGRVATGPSMRLPASTYRRRRAVAAGLAIGLVLAMWAALGTLGGGSLPAPERPSSGVGSAATQLRPQAVYVVQQGDTFWSIARRLRPDGDPRPVVDRLVAAHGGATLYVGERIRLPG